MDNENLYTPSANNVLRIAQEQARFFKHQAVGTEHLLLALSLEKVGVAATVLHQFNVTSDDLREEIERYTGYGTKTPLAMRTCLIRQSYAKFWPWRPAWPNKWGQDVWVLSTYCWPCCQMRPSFPRGSF